MRNRDYKIRAGHHTDISSSSYLIRNLPAQSDQRWNVKWVEPELAVPPRAVEVVEMQDGSILPNGCLYFEWRFSYLIFSMYKHWNTTYLPSGVFSAEVTVQLYDDYDDSIIYQATMQHRYSEDREKAPGGYRNIIYRFVDAVEVEP